MPDYNLAKQPRFPIVKLDTNEPVTEEQLLELLNQNNGLTLCIRSLDGHANRGGHFFCIQKQEDGNILLETMEQEYVDTFPTPSMIRFINHACGIKFDKEMQQYCQNSLNFRTD